MDILQLAADTAKFLAPFCHFRLKVEKPPHYTDNRQLITDY